jgi:L-alanine-DL-glutamate epimerase-like enolase superfamily enzyme
MSSPVAGSCSIPVDQVDVSVYRIPTDAPESDGTLCWDSTTLVLVTITGAGACGLGYTYADATAATLIHDRFAPLLRGVDAWRHAEHAAMLRQVVRNAGYAGIAATAISAVDVALWDLKCRVLGVPLVNLLGRARSCIPVYGSGGFTSYSDAQLRRQFEGWGEQGIRHFKMKVGREPTADPARVRAARDTIGEAAALFVDANGAYTRPQALALAQRFHEYQVTWFEEPVSSDDLHGLNWLHDRAPPGMAVAAGEYGYDAHYFRHMLDAQAVHVLQADATRCGGITGFLAAAALCEAYGLPLSSHCAPALHVSLDCAVARAIHLEYFHDHVRIEHELFDGAMAPVDACLAPALDRPGLGLDFKHRDAERYRQ